MGTGDTLDLTRGLSAWEEGLDPSWCTPPPTPSLPPLAFENTFCPVLWPLRPDSAERATFLGPIDSPHPCSCPLEQVGAVWNGLSWLPAPTLGAGLVCLGESWAGPLRRLQPLRTHPVAVAGWEAEGWGWVGGAAGRSFLHPLPVVPLSGSQGVPGRRLECVEEQAGQAEEPAVLPCPRSQCVLAWAGPPGVAAWHW